MADDAKPEDTGQESGGDQGHGSDVARVIQILNAKVSIDDTHLPLASPQIELGSADQRKIVCLTMTREHAETFQKAWQQKVHSMSQTSGKYLVSDFNPSATPDVRYGADVRYFSQVNYCDISYASVTYAELRAGGATRLDVEYAGVTYKEASHREVLYSAALGKRLIEEEPRRDETLIPLTIRGDSRRANRRMVLQIDGIGEVDTRDSLAGDDLVDVLIQLASKLPIDKLIWLIESE